MGRTKIEWCARPGTIPVSWSPVTGCSKVSGGCKHCYAERAARRLAGRHGYPEAPHHFDVTLHPDRQEQPLQWKKPRTVFVCSMGDLFHESVPDEFIARVFATMDRARRHTFQVLTKRPERMKAWIEEWSGSYVAPKIWLGITAENQAMADERIPLLLQIPAAVRFVSCEPLLGPIELRGEWLYELQEYGLGPISMIYGHDIASLGELGWIIVGGESGPSARPMHPQWARDIRDQCQAASVPFFFKQHGRWLHESQRGLKMSPGYMWPDHTLSYGVGKKRAGRLLDGKEWSEFPQENQ